MVRLIFAFSTLCLLIAAPSSPALAIGEDVFVVPRVTVQARADSATAAKAAAQRHGRRRAMDILLRRLTVEEDWIYLPKLASDEPARSLGGFGRSAIALTDRDLELLESGFEVYDERSSSSTYRAFITFRFKPASVRRLLKDAQIPYSEAQTRTALVLPVLETASGVYLWEENNPWMAAWKLRPFNNELTPMIAPLGDLEDAATIGPRQALALNQAALEEMALRYSVAQVIIAHARLEQAEGEDRLHVRLVNGFRESGELEELEELGAMDDQIANQIEQSNTPPVETYAGDVNQAEGADEFLPARVGDVLAEARFAQLSGNFPTLAEISIDATLAAYAKPWKQRTLIDHTIAALLDVSAYYRSLGEWTKIRSALVSTPLIGSVQVRSLSRSGAEMLIRAYGDPSKLIVAMEAQGLALWTEDDEHWLIATPAAAQGVRRGGRLGAYDDRDPSYRSASREQTRATAKIETDF